MKNIILTAFEHNQPNPFVQYPQLKSIWRPTSAQLAQEAIDEDIEFLLAHPNADIGQVFLIWYEEQGKKTLMGITGYTPDDEAPGDILLRWHGLLPAFRNFGYSQDIIYFIIDLIQAKYPEASRFVEYMPIVMENIELAQYFEKLGFQKVGEPQKFKWSDYLWQSYVINLPFKPIANLVPVKGNMNI